jgi:phenylacetate-CoA ligase
MLITSGEYLDAVTAASAKGVFGSSPYQFYGSWEMGRIANECPSRDGLHVNEDQLIAEFLPEDPEGKSDRCRLVLTNLFNHVMPFIRYEQGDLVVPKNGPCECGCNFVRLELKEGRHSATISLPDGNRISVLRLTGLMFSLPGVRQFRFVQEDLRNLTIQIVRNEDFSSLAMNQTVRRLEGLLPGQKVRVDFTDRIKPNSSGKTCQFESRLGKPNEKYPGD